jgi:hypothetical protein
MRSHFQRDAASLQLAVQLRNRRLRCTHAPLPHFLPVAVEDEIAARSILGRIGSADRIPANIDAVKSGKFTLMVRASGLQELHARARIIRQTAEQVFAVTGHLQ